MAPAPPAVWSDGGVVVERLRSWKTREFKSNRITVGSYYAIFVEHDGSVGLRDEGGSVCS